MMLRKRTRKEGRTRTHSNHHQRRKGEPPPAVTSTTKENGAYVTPAPVATDLPANAPTAMDTGEMVAGVTAKDFHTQMMLRKRTRKEGRTRTHSNHHQKIKRRRD